MKLGSFCTGYGGLDMAVEAHFGATLTWYSEVSKDCNQLLAHYWPGVPNLGDLTAIDWDQVEPVDIMCAGFPCQPFSHAGKREGANDERAIFSYIADAVGVLRPGIVVLENVAGLLSTGPGRGGGCDVVGTLAGMGYDLRWGLVRASDAGAPHRRARWFCVATDTDGPGRGEQRRTVPVGTQQRPAERGRSQAEWGHYAPAIERWERTIDRPASAPTDDGKLSSRFVEWMMGLPEGWVTNLGLSRTAELKMLGNGVVPQQASLALEILDG
jgi:DNA (cytosine-5)-methyltransferase 1